MFKDISCLLNNELSKTYGIKCDFDIPVAIEKSKDIEELLDRGKTLIDTLKWVEFPELIIRFDEEKIQDIGQKYFNKENELFRLMCNLSFFAEKTPTSKRSVGGG